MSRSTRNHISSALAWLRGEKKPAPPLKIIREFVYLDEVSVYSLSASRFGMLDDTETEGTAHTTASAISGSATKNLAVIKGTLKGELTDSTTASSQVVRKSIIQSTFRKLYLDIENSLVRPLPPDQAPPRITNITDLFTTATDNHWVIDPGTFSRGTLTELNVTLAPEAIFQVQSMMSSLLELLDKHPELQTGHDMGKAAIATDMLEGLLSGLVPIRGHCTDYNAVKNNDKTIVVHKKVLKQIEPTPNSEKIYLVGVAEQRLFWKDTRRILFSNCDYTVLARIRCSGLQPSWEPVKLLEGLARVFPPAADALRNFNAIALDMVAGSPPPALRCSTLDREVRVHFARSVASELNHDLDEETLTSNGHLDHGTELTDVSTIDNIRAALHPIEEYIHSQSGATVSPERLSELRMEARHRLGQRTTDSEPRNSDDDEYLLDAELIAIYW